MKDGTRDTGHGKRERLALLLAAMLAVAVVGWLGFLAPDTWHLTPSVSADSYSYNRKPQFGYLIDTPAISLAAASVTTSPTPTTGVHSADVNLVFGTVTGTYTTCTAQAYTSFDGANYLTLGSAASLTVTTSTVNAWTILSQAPTTSVTTSSVSSSAAVDFGRLTKYTVSCSGAYGTLAPAVLTVIYRW